MQEKIGKYTKTVAKIKRHYCYKVNIDLKIKIVIQEKTAAIE